MRSGLLWRSEIIQILCPSVAANWAALGILFNTGQDCTAGSRVYVQDTVYDKFMSILVQKAKQLVVSHGFDEAASAGPVVSADRFHSTFIPPIRAQCQPFDLWRGTSLTPGPIFSVSKTQYERVWNYIESGKSEGAKIVFGGEKRSTKGYWVDPTSQFNSIHSTLFAGNFIDALPPSSLNKSSPILNPR